MEHISQQTPVYRPVNWMKPTHVQLSGHIRNTNDLRYTNHAAQDRMEKRGITEQDVQDIAFGGVVYKVEPGNRKGEWKVNLHKTVRGRTAAVALLVKHSLPYAVVLTAMWRDVC